MIIAGILLGIMFGTGIGIVIMALMISASSYSDDVMNKESNYMLENSEELFPNKKVDK